MLSGLNSQWVTNSSNGLHSNGHPQWRMVQLETAKLLELGCVLPATNLPHFQMWVCERASFGHVMQVDRTELNWAGIDFSLLFGLCRHCSRYRYRWAFVGGVNDDYLPEMSATGTGAGLVNGSGAALHSVFIPHVTRIARLMDLRFTTHSPVRIPGTRK